MRARIVRLMREHLDAQGFVEVETPMLTRSTPEGSRDFLVPSRLWPGTFYALPQSPQQLKQLLMVGGQDRYYQIVRCLRDEASRADRGFEFTQLDVEMSFVTEQDLIDLIEPLYARIVGEVAGAEVTTPFPQLTYDEMMARFGSDKPDLRYGMELADLAAVFADDRIQRVRVGARERRRDQGARRARRRIVLTQGARPPDRRRQGARCRRPRLDGRRGRTASCARRSRSSSRPTSSPRW